MTKNQISLTQKNAKMIYAKMTVGDIFKKVKIDYRWY